MNINTVMDGSKATVAVEGRLETTNAGSLEQEFSGLYDQVDELVVDCTNLEYISSSGLRTLLSAVKTMKKKGGFKRSLELSKEYNLYRQQYCGCIYSQQN